MSSTIEGRDDWARDDELDLGQENEELHPDRTGNGAVIMSNGEPRDETDDSVTEGEQESFVAENHDDHHPVDSVHLADTPVENVPLSQPKELHRASTSLDDRASTPDDTPSLHVRCNISLSVPLVQPLLSLLSCLTFLFADSY